MPLALGTVAAMRHVPETRDDTASGPPDLFGAVVASLSLASMTAGLIEKVWWLEGVAAILVVVFVVVERRDRNPILPLEVFRSLQFTGANLTTLAVYGALGGFMFLVILNLELVMGYSAVSAGAAMLPITGLMLALSPRMGQLSQRIGPRVPMTLGPLVVAGGVLLLVRAVPGHSYPSGVLPGVVVFGLGLAITVGPLTGTVLAAVDQRHVGAASGVNNAASRVAGLVTVALLPEVTHMGSSLTRASVSAGYHGAMVIERGHRSGRRGHRVPHHPIVGQDRADGAAGPPAAVPRSVPRGGIRCGRLHDRGVARRRKVIGTGRPPTMTPDAVFDRHRQGMAAGRGRGCPRDDAGGLAREAHPGPPRAGRGRGPRCPLRR